MLVSLCSGFLGLLGSLFCAPAQAQQFSADLVSPSAGGGTTARPARLRVADGKVRIETPEVPDGFFLVEAPEHAYFVRPAVRIFMDARQSSRLTQWFVPLDPADPCRQWQAMAKLAGATEQDGEWRCERIGPDTIEGRGVEMVRTVAPQNREVVVWIDSQLKFPLKVRLKDGVTIVVSNIKYEAQPAGLFEIPASFHKFDPSVLIERIKQSDVWVEAPR